MHLSDVGSRRDWITALAWRSTTAGLAALAALTRLGQRMVPRLRPASNGFAASEPGPAERLPDGAECTVWRSETAAHLHLAAADALEAAEDDLLQLIAEVGAAMTLPTRQIHPVPAPKPMIEPIAA